MPMTNPICLTDLPEGILMYIAGFLCLKDFLTLCSVSKNLTDIFNKYLTTGTDSYFSEPCAYKDEKLYTENFEASKQQLLYSTLIALEKAHVDTFPISYLPCSLRVLLHRKLRGSLVLTEKLFFSRYILHHKAKEHALHVLNTNKMESFLQWLHEISHFVHPYCLGKLMRSIAMSIYKAESLLGHHKKYYMHMVEFLNHLTKQVTNYWKAREVFRYLDGIVLLTWRHSPNRNINYMLLDADATYEANIQRIVDVNLLVSLLVRLHSCWQPQFTSKYIKRLVMMGFLEAQEVLVSLADYLLYQDFAQVLSKFSIDIISNVLRKVFVRNQLGPRAVSTYISSVTCEWDETQKYLLQKSLSWRDALV
ncbi:hypothetical protein GpartN1_g1493.t1 [Galdieria partita]|uniref:F-box domain-containing protein n=1 Tax=Galdieria partita TaxID=83374 RepID=A0A9C7PU72_9RHOD|nr:hypothetical protein GpartN1_g1493.t1 [Galdieria partita]